ncbi:MAG TPA: hypothetical protein VGN57_19470 [Pirellulaceae bacterium]|jgi:hypothetical protein|nr:hypothetical protein [Pirellulaceae bacterium]
MKPILLALGAGLAVAASLSLASPALGQQNANGQAAPELLVAPVAQPQETVRLAPLSEQFVPLVPAKKPLTMVNYVAMQRAAERRARLDAQAWYGISNLRPTLPASNFFGDAMNGYPGYAYAPYQGPPNYYAPMVFYHSVP